MTSEPVRVLELSLYGDRVGFLAGYQGGYNILVFDDAFALDPSRPTLTLTTQVGFPKADELLAAPWIRRQRLHPVLSNLLPEGALRDWLAQRLKVHPDHEFPLMAALGRDLPGALVATPLPAEQVPDWALAHRNSVASMVEDVETLQGFSLAGVQMKFSMRLREGRFRLGLDGETGDWIVKTPSTRFGQVPENEYSAMKLAEAAGVSVPEVRLVSTDELDGLPPLSMPKGEPAYAVQRVDRSGQGRVHIEDFAQVLFRYPHEKYEGANYERIGRILYDYSGDNLANVQEMARRLLVNILLANGDAHLKNWSLVYPDRHRAELAPAYDIVVARAYIEGETRAALNLNRKKDWYHIGWSDFEAWARHSGVPWAAIEGVLQETMERARESWPALLATLPMAGGHKAVLREHWDRLRPEWRI